MSLLLKVALPCIIGTAGAGVVGSNWVFTKKEEVTLKETADERWNEKLTLLLTKLSSDNSLAAKIDKSTSTQTLAITSGSNSSKFTNEAGAKKALQDWCKSTDKGDTSIHEKSLCKVKETRGWIF